MTTPCPECVVDHSTDATALALLWEKVREALEAMDEAGLLDHESAAAARALLEEVRQ